MIFCSVCTMKNLQVDYEVQDFPLKSIDVESCTQWKQYKYPKMKYKHSTWVTVPTQNVTFWDYYLNRCLFVLVSSEFPPITNEQKRTDYKHEFDREHQEYKDLQAELDAINRDLSKLDKELDGLEEGSPQYLVRAYRKNTLIIQCVIFTFSLLYIISHSLEPLEVKPNIPALLIQFEAYEKMLAM